MKEKREQSEKGIRFEVELKKSGIKKADLARMVGFSAQGINNWRYRGVPAREAPDVAVILDCEPSDISEITSGAPAARTEQARLDAAKKAAKSEVQEFLDSLQDLESLEFVLTSVEATKKLLSRRS